MEKAFGNKKRNRSAVGELMVWLVLVILLSSIAPIPVSAEVVWSDNFNDGNYDGWRSDGYNFTGYPFAPITPCVANFSATENTLRATGPEYNYAVHPSSVAYGTWSFDLHVAQTPRGYSIIFFISSNFSQFLTDVTGYSLQVYMDGRLNLKRNDHTPPIEDIGSYNGPDLSGLQAINITRSESGQFRVYINGTVLIEVEDSTYTTSDDFCFGSESGQAIDNVVVSNTVDLEPTTTTTTTSETDSTGVPLEPLVIGIGGVAVVLIVVVVILRRR